MMREGDGPERRATAAVLAAFGLLAVFFSGVFPPFSNPNELSRFQTVVAAVDHGTFSVDAVIADLGDHEDKAAANGKLYSNKAPGLALAAIPVYGLLRAVFPAPATANADSIFRLMRLLTVSLLSLLALARFGRRVAAWTSPAAAPLVLCAVALGTPYLFYARSFFSHSWTAALLFLSWDSLASAEEIERPRGGKVRLSAGGFLAGWAAISEYTVAPVALLLAIRSFAGRRPPRLGLFVVGAAIPLALLGIYDTICFGAPWVLSSAREADPSYSQLAQTGLFGFGAPRPEVALAYLVHPARGVLIFSPFLAWCVPGFARWWKSGEHRADCLLALTTTALYFVAMTGYPNWHGGWALGSRYLLPALLFPAVAIGFALSTALSRGLFAAAVVFSVAGHYLLTATFPYFPDNIAWPVATGSLWFLERGWVAPNLLDRSSGGLAALALSGAAFAVPLILSLRAAGTMLPRRAIGALLGLAPLAVLLLRPPELSFGARLWRSAIYGAYSGRDPKREELRAVALTAATPAEQRQAVGSWRVYGPPRP
jgi:hypothetical protein